MFQTAYRQCLKDNFVLPTTYPIETTTGTNESEASNASLITQENAEIYGRLFKKIVYIQVDF